MSRRKLTAAQVRPDGSGLRRVFDSRGGLANHPKFSPKFTPEAGRIVFTSDFAGYSAEEIALPHQFQPYGDLFSINIDGTDLQRLTHGGCHMSNPMYQDVVEKGRMLVSRMFSALWGPLSSLQCAAKAAQLVGPCAEGSCSHYTSFKRKDD